MEKILNKQVEIEPLNREYVKALIQIILDNTFKDPERRRIVEHKDRLNFCCPICGDSKSNRKKRGNLYNNLYYICYNEGCRCSFLSLLKKFNIDIDLNEKIKIYDYLDQNITYKSSDVEFDNFDKLFNVEDLMTFYNDDITHKITELKPLQPGGEVYNYVKTTRKIPRTEDIYQGYYNYTDKWKQPVMVYMNKLKGRVISMQVRNLLGGEKRMFKIYDFSKIYNEVYPDVELDEQEKLSLNKLSHFFNIFHVDFSQPTNFFEGYIDSIFLKNSIGMIGLNTDLSFLLKEDGLDLRFIYDNDVPGFKKSKKMMLDGKKVFLWNKFFLDLVLNYKGNIKKIELVRKLQHIKDFNQLAMIFKKTNVFSKIDNPKYFSRDSIDNIYFNTLEYLFEIYN